MANIDESGIGGTYPASVVSLAATDAAEGAAEGSPNSGVMNGPIVALTGRTKYLKTLADTHTGNIANLVTALSVHTNQIAAHSGQITSHGARLDSIEASDITQDAEIAALQVAVEGQTAIPVLQTGNVSINGSGEGAIDITDARVTGIDALKGFELLLKYGSNYLVPPKNFGGTKDYEAYAYFITTYKQIIIKNAASDWQSSTVPYRLIIKV